MGTTVFATVSQPGPPGPTGPAGYAPVFIVAAGPPSNAIGNDHDMYIDSTNGNVYGPKISGLWGAVVCNIKGSTGATGAQGPPGYSPQYIVAAGTPSAGQGNNGDMFINSSTSDVYGPKAAGAWGPIVCNIKGQTGAQGPPGVGYRPMGQWLVGSTYLQGDQVTDLNILYISLQGNNTGHTPASSPSWWETVGSGSSQTPWLSDIDGAGHTLVNLGAISENANGLVRLPITNANTGAASRMDIAINATYGGTGGTMFIGASNNAYGMGETNYVDVQAGKLLLNASYIITPGANLGIGVGNISAIPQKLTVNGPANVASNTGGTFTAVAAFGSTNTAQQIDFGIYPNSPYGAWIQVRHQTANGGSWPLILQPLIGQVGIGRVPTNFPLEVQGQIVAVEQAGYWASLGMDVAATPSGINNFAHWYDGNINMGRLEAITSGSQYRNVVACGTGTSFCVGSAWLSGFTPQAIVDINTNTGGDVDALFLRSAIGTMGDGPALKFGQNSGSALFCRLKALYNTNSNGMDLAFWSYNNGTATEKMRISAAGFISVGITTAIAANVMPQVPIDILTSQGVGLGLRLRQANVPANDYFTFIVDQSVNGAMRIDGYDGGTTATGLVQQRDGRIGVRNLNPGYSLDVTGDVNCSGSFRVNGAPISAGLIGLTAGVSSNLNVTGTLTDVPGTAFTLSTGGLWLILATVHFQGGSDATLNIICYINVAGANQPTDIHWGPGSGTGSEGSSTAHVVTRQNAGAVVKLQANKSGSGTATITTQSCVSAIWIAP
jgi:hypothetical protein